MHSSATSIFPHPSRCHLFAGPARFAVKPPDSCATGKNSPVSYYAMQPVIFMLNPAIGGASPGVWGRNPSAVKIMLSESFL